MTIAGWQNGDGMTQEQALRLVAAQPALQFAPGFPTAARGVCVSRSCGDPQRPPINQRGHVLRRFIVGLAILGAGAQTLGTPYYFDLTSYVQLTRKR
jgi:hypothetical protein